MSQSGGFGRRAVKAGKWAAKKGWQGIRILSWLPYIVVFVLFLIALSVFQVYYALSRETVVAEVIMSPMQTDANGTYIEIQFIPYNLPSAWATVLEGGADHQMATPGTPQTYKVYGDTVAVRGPLIALQNGWRIFNFDNIFKLALIEGEYRAPGTAAAGEGSEFEINGGFSESWWNVNAQEAQFPYNTVVKRVTFSGDEEPGFTGNFKKRYQIVVTADAITWNFIDNVQN